jgi:gas vesicle structural protein
MNMTHTNTLSTMCRSRAVRPRGFERPATLSEVLDRVLNKGAVVVGEVVISVAGVDLLYLGLNVVLTSVETARTLQSNREPQNADC